MWRKTKGKGAPPFEFVRLGAGGFGALGEVIGIKPLADCEASAFQERRAAEGAVLGHVDGVGGARKKGASGGGQRVYKRRSGICQS